MTVNLKPQTVLIDIKTGLPTRDMFLFLNELQVLVNSITSDVVQVDSLQTLTGKTMDGDANTFQDIHTSSLKSRTGDGARVATAAVAGTTGELAVWTAAGNLGSTSNYTTTTDLTTLLAAKQNAGGIVTLASYTVATLPSVSAAQLIYVSDESGGAVPAFSDGANWLRVTDRAIVS